MTDALKVDLNQAVKDASREKRDQGLAIPLFVFAEGISLYGIYDYSKKFSELKGQFKAHVAMGEEIPAELAHGLKYVPRLKSSMVVSSLFFGMLLYFAVRDFKRAGRSLKTLKADLSSNQIDEPK